MRAGNKCEEMKEGNRIVVLCRFLITRKRTVEQILGAERYEEFCLEITAWRDEYLNGGRPQQAAAQRLCDICEQFGLVESDEFAGELGGATRVRGGAIRTRGGRVLREADLPEQLLKVAESFSSKEA